MAKSALKIQARALRSQGESNKKIAKRLGVSRSTVSLWVRDIILTQTQLEALHQAVLKGSAIGRMASVLAYRDRRLRRQEEAKKEAMLLLSRFTKREHLIAGLALYWGEGSKKNGQVQFCNSDPKMIQFLLVWLRKCLDVPKEDIRCWVGINEIHQEREKLVVHYWSTVSRIPLEQFRGTSFKKVVNKKIYENFEEHYGTLFVTVVKSTLLYIKIIGLVEALQEVGVYLERNSSPA